MKEVVFLGKFQYVAVTKEGKKMKGSIEGPNKETVTMALKAKGWYPSSVTEENVFNRSINWGSGKLPIRQVSLFCRQFSMLLKAGISISNGLDIFRQQIEDKRLAQVISDMYEDVLKGDSLSDAMKKTKKFPDLLPNMIQAGETGGIMDEVLERMATYYEKETKTKNKVKNALTYPIMVLVIAMLVVVLLLVAVIPSFVEMFAAMGQELPFLTRFMIAASEFMIKNWYIVLGIPTIIGITIFFYTKTPNGRQIKDSLILKLPLFGPLTKKGAIARFTRTLSIMSRAGLPMMISLEMIAKVSDNFVIEQGVLQAREEVSRGRLLSDAISDMNLFTPMVVSMMKIGEETGGMEEMMERCADFYDEEVDLATSKLTTMLEPMILLFLAVVIGSILVAVLQPMTGMVSGIENLS